MTTSTVPHWRRRSWRRRCTAGTREAGKRGIWVGTLLPSLTPGQAVRFEGPFSLVLGGGGLKGMSHIGVFQALEEFGMDPELVVGCSMGALIAAAWCAGKSARELREIALEVRRKDVFRIAHLDMALLRMRAPAVYRSEPLDELIHRLVGNVTFKQLKHRLVIATVDLNTGGQILWGQPGLDDVKVADAVFASCALPGLFPRRDIDGGGCG